MLVSDFNLELPEDLIAQEPLADRAGSRLLHVNPARELADLRFRDLPNILKESDLLVFNNTKVLPARLLGHRRAAKAQILSPDNLAGREFLPGQVEVLLTRQSSQNPNEWECLVRPGKRIQVGERLFFGERPELRAEVVARGEFGERRIRFEPVGDFFGVLERIGHVPLPPYISRGDRMEDRERYQTVYARERGSVAAPTAGLHFTPQVIDLLKQRGIETTEITLHVGLGTFQPIRVERVEDHRLHSERYGISAGAAEQINGALAAGRRVVAVGTTTVRTLEHAAKLGSGDGIGAGSGEADPFIYPGYEFQVVGAMLTNFHLPQSSLLMLVCALGGRDAVLKAYRHAVREKYRFYSYGDCMFLERPEKE